MRYSFVLRKTLFISYFHSRSWMSCIKVYTELTYQWFKPPRLTRYIYQSANGGRILPNTNHGPFLSLGVRCLSPSFVNFKKIPTEITAGYYNKVKSENWNQFRDIRTNVHTRKKIKLNTPSIMVGHKTN